MFKCIFLNENVWMPIEISQKFVPKGSINNNSALLQIMAWRCPGNKQLSEPMMVSSLTHICVTRPQWVKVNLLKRYPRTCTLYSKSLPIKFSSAYPLNWSKNWHKLLRILKKTLIFWHGILCLKWWVPYSLNISWQIYSIFRKKWQHHIPWQGSTLRVIPSSNPTWFVLRTSWVDNLVVQF